MKPASLALLTLLALFACDKPHSPTIAQRFELTQPDSGKDLYLLDTTTGQLWAWQFENKPTSTDGPKGKWQPWASPPVVH